jgi:hypothetical protein
VAIFIAWLVTATLNPYNASLLEEGNAESKREFPTFVALTLLFYLLIWGFSKIYIKYNGSTAVAKITKRTKPAHSIIFRIAAIAFVAVILTGIVVQVGAAINPLKSAEIQVIADNYMDGIIKDSTKEDSAIKEFAPTGYEFIESAKPPGQNRLRTRLYERHITYALTNNEPFKYMYVVLNVGRIIPWTDGKASLLRTETHEAGLSSKGREIVIQKKLINSSVCDKNAKAVLLNESSTESEKQQAIIDRNLCVELSNTFDN